MAKKKKRRNRLPAPECLRITRYTEAAWMRCYPESNHQEWYACQQPYCNSNYALENLDTLGEEFGFNPENIRQIRMVVLDDSYFSHLEETGNEDTPQTRSEYDLPDDRARELFEKYGFDNDYHLMLLPVVGFQEEKNKKYSLGKESQEEIRECLGRVYGKENVWFPGFVMEPDTAVDNEERILSIANSFFRYGQKINVGAFQTAEVENEFAGTDGPNGMVFFLFLPFVVKGTLARHCISDADMDLDDIRNFPDEHTFDFLGCGIEEKVQKDFGMEASCFDEALHVLDVGCFMEDILEELGFDIDS